LEEGEGLNDKTVELGSFSLRSKLEAHEGVGINGVDVGGGACGSTR
jgi:hypothetical protein